MFSPWVQVVSIDGIFHASELESKQADRKLFEISFEYIFQEVEPSQISDQREPYRSLRAILNGEIYLAGKSLLGTGLMHGEDLAQLQPSKRYFENRAGDFFINIIGVLSFTHSVMGVCSACTDPGIHSPTD